MNLDIFNQQYSQEYIVTEQVYQTFQQCSGDYNPLHTDETFAKSKGFPERVMYGNILNAFISHFIGMVLPTQEVIIHSQEIYFRNPVFLNDHLLLSAQVANISEMVNVVEFKFTFRKQDGKVVAKGNIQIGVI